MQLVHNNVNGDRLKIAKNRKKLILFSSTLTFRWYDLILTTVEGMGLEVTT